jgi:hypothetical protein
MRPESRKHLSDMLEAVKAILEFTDGKDFAQIARAELFINASRLDGKIELGRDARLVTRDRAMRESGLVPTLS